MNISYVHIKEMLSILSENKATVIHHPKYPKKERERERGREREKERERGKTEREERERESKRVLLSLSRSFFGMCKCSFIEMLTNYFRCCRLKILMLSKAQQDDV